MNIIHYITFSYCLASTPSARLACGTSPPGEWGELEDSEVTQYVTFSLSLTISCPQCGHTSILPPQGVTPQNKIKTVLNKCRNAGPAGLITSIAVVQTPQSCSDLLTVSQSNLSDLRAAGEHSAGQPHVPGGRGGLRGQLWTQQSRARQLPTGGSPLLQTRRSISIYYLDIRYLLFKVLNILPTKSWELWNSLGAVAV